MASLNSEASTSSNFSKMDKKSNMDDRTAKFIVIFVIIANLIAVLALILSFVGVFGSNQYCLGSTSADGAYTDSQQVLAEEDFIWTFHIGHYAGNTQYLDETTGTIKGYNVDVVNAVCQLANKNCRLTWDLYQNCWDSQAGERPRGGQGLMGGSWYDACVGWANTRDRARTYQFSSSFEKSFAPTYWVKPGGSFNNPDLTGLNVAILDGWSVEEHCLARYDDVIGFDAFNASRVIHYTSADDIITALKTDVVDVAFLPRIPYLDAHMEIELANYQPTTDLCVFGGPAMMMPKDQFELVTWWNAAFDRLKDTYIYRDVCEDLKIAHGDQPGNDPEYVCID